MKTPPRPNGSFFANTSHKPTAKDQPLAQRSTVLGCPPPLHPTILTPTSLQSTNQKKKKNCPIFPTPEANVNHPS